MAIVRAYLKALSVPGALRFVGPAFLARFPGAMIGIALTLMVSGLYKEYSLAGLVGACWTVSAAVGAPLVGRLIDRYGQARIGFPLVALSSIATVALIISALNHATWPLLVVTSAVSGLAGFPMGSLTRSRWSHLLGPDPLLQSAFALESMFDDVAFIVGPTVATIVATAVWPRLGVRPEAAMVLSVVIMAVAVALFLSQRATEPPVRPAEHRSSAIRVPGVGLVAVVFIGIGVIFGANDITIVAVAEALGHKAWSGPILGAGSVASMTGALIYGSRAWRMPLVKRFVIGLVFVAGTSLLFLLAFHWWSLTVVSILSGLAISPSFINGNTLIQRIVPPANLTEGLTWIGTALLVGIAGGGALAGRVIDSFGPHSGYWVLAGGCVTAIIVGALSGQTLGRRVGRAAA